MAPPLRRTLPGHLIGRTGVAVAVTVGSAVTCAPAAKPNGGRFCNGTAGSNGPRGFDFRDTLATMLRAPQAKQSSGKSVSPQALDWRVRRGSQRYLAETGVLPVGPIEVT